MVRPISFCLILATVVSGGCREQLPAPPAQKEGPTVEEIEHRLKTEFAIVYLILPKKAESKYDGLARALDPLLDDQKNMRRDLLGSGYLRQLKVAPVKDVEALGKNQTLGSVVAYDPAKRTLLIEYGAVPAAREAWKDATFLDRQVHARKAQWGLEVAARNLSEQYPPNQVVYVHVLMDVDPSTDLREKLLPVCDGPVEKRAVHSLTVTQEGDGWMTVIAPVKDLDALAKKIDFGKVVFFDTEHNVLILELPRKGKK